LSPDGKRIALIIAGATDALFIYDIARGTLSRATFEGNTSTVSWMPDGETLIYSSDRESGGIFRSRMDGTGTPVKILPSLGREIELFSGSSRHVLLYTKGAPGERDIWSCGLEEGGVESPLIQTPYDQWSPQLSPNGKWLAYVSDESGRSEIYVTTFPPGAGRWQISKDGANTPRWSADGQELCFISGSNLVAEVLESTRTLLSVSVSGGDGFEVGPPRKIFEWTGLGLMEMSRDRESLLVMRRREPKYRPTEIYAVLNWVEELKEKVAVR